MKKYTGIIVYGKLGSEDWVMEQPCKKECDCEICEKGKIEFYVKEKKENAIQ